MKQLHFPLKESVETSVSMRERKRKREREGDVGTWKTAILTYYFLATLCFYIQGPT